MSQTPTDVQSIQRANGWSEILDHCLDAVYLLSPTGALLDANPHFCRMLKQSREALLGTPIENWVERDGRKVVERVLKHMAKTRNACRSNRVFQALDKEQITVETIEIPHILDGNIVSISGIARDITQEVALERKLWDSGEAHEQAVEFALRTSLGLVKGYVYTLGQSNELDAERRRRYIRVIEDEIDQLSKLIEDMLDVRKLDPIELDTRGEPVDVVACVESAVRQCGADAERRDIVLNSQLPESMAPLFGSTDAVQRVALNLIQNAIQHAMHSGHVSVELNDSDAWVELCVRDDGMGISDRELPHIFDRYYRGSGSITSNPGLGLGLAVTKTFVNAMGGKIWVKSLAEKGNEFTVTLPRRPVEDSADSDVRMQTTVSAAPSLLPQA